MVCLEVVFKTGVPVRRFGGQSFAVEGCAVLWLRTCQGEAKPQSEDGGNAQVWLARTGASAAPA